MIHSKYVVLKERYGTDRDGKFLDKENIYVFEPNIIHKDFVMNNSSRRRCVGAGFISRTKDGFFCYGRSDSLDVDSRKEDTILLKILLGDTL